MPDPMTAEELQQEAVDFVAELCVHQDADQAIRRAIELLARVRRDARCKALEEAIAVVAENEMCDDCMHALERFIAKHDAKVAQEQDAHLAQEAEARSHLEAEVKDGS